MRRQPDGQLLLPHVGHRLLGADLQELGLAEPHHDRARRLRRALRVPRRRLLQQPVPDDGRAAARRPGRRSATRSTRASRSRATPTTCSRRAPRSRRCRTRSAPRSRRSRADEVVQSAMPGRLYKVFDWYKRDEWERYLAAVTDWERDEYLEVLPRCAASPGIIYKTRNGERRSGREMTAHAAVDEAPRARLDRLRAVRRRRPRTGSCASSSPTPTRPRDFEFGDRLRRNKAEIERRLGAPRRDRCTDRRRDGVRLRGALLLRRRPQGAGRPGRGRARRRGALARPLAADHQGPRRRGVGVGPLRPRRARRHARASATSAWRRSPTSTSPARTRTGRIRSPTSPSSTTAS